MKTKNATSKKLKPPGFRVNKTLAKKYTDEPLFKEKTEQANQILKTFGIPKM